METEETDRVLVFSALNHQNFGAQPSPSSLLVTQLWILEARETNEHFDNHEKRNRKNTFTGFTVLGSKVLKIGS